MFNNEIIFESNIIINIIIAILSLIIAYYSYKAHKITNSYKFGYFSLAFLCLFSSFILNAFSKIILALNAAKIIGTLTFNSYVATNLLTNFFMLLGFMLLFFATRNNMSSKAGVFTTFLFILAIVLSLKSFIIMNLVAISLLLAIMIHYFIQIKTKVDIYKFSILVSVFLFLLAKIILIITQYSGIVYSVIFLLAFFIMYIIILKLYKYQ